MLSVPQALASTVDSCPDRGRLDSNPPASDWGGLSTQPGLPQAAVLKTTIPTNYHPHHLHVSYCIQEALT